MTISRKLAQAGALALAATVVVAMCPAGSATAAPAAERAMVPVDITIKVTANHKKLKGKATSSIPDCAQDAYFYLYGRKPGSGDYDLYASGYTSAEGKWSVKGRPPTHKIPNGKYYLSLDGAYGYCDDAKSRKLKVD